MIMIQTANNATDTANQRAWDITVLPEPGLEFRYSQRVLDPRDGLSLFGPFDTDLPGSPKNVSYGIIGTPQGISVFNDFSKFLVSPSISETPSKNQRLWPAFPGFDVAFHCKLPRSAPGTFQLEESSV